MPDQHAPCQSIWATIVGNSENSLIPITESFWARPIESDRYEVCDVLYHFPLVAGDQIVIAPSTHSQPVVTDVIKLMPGWYMRGQLVEDFHQATIAFNKLEQTADTLESGHGAFFGHWGTNYKFEDLAEILHDAQSYTGFTVIYHEIARRDWLHNYVNFEADQHSTPTTVEYWAANDPKWRELGFTSPSFLAHVQTLVRDNPDLLKLIEARQYQKALRWISKYDEVFERLTSA